MDPTVIPLFGLAAKATSSSPLSDLANQFLARHAAAGPDAVNATLISLMAPIAHASSGLTARQPDQTSSASDTARATDKLRARDGITAYKRLEADAAGSSSPRYQSRGSG